MTRVQGNESKLSSTLPWHHPEFMHLQIWTWKIKIFWQAASAYIRIVTVNGTRSKGQSQRNPFQCSPLIKPTGGEVGLKYTCIIFKKNLKEHLKMLYVWKWWTQRTYDQYTLANGCWCCMHISSKDHKLSKGTFVRSSIIAMTMNFPFLGAKHSIMTNTELL